MKKIALLLAVMAVLVFAGCSSAPAEQPGGEQPSGNRQVPNVWVVREQAPLIDADTGKEAGTVYPGFALALQNEKDGKALFSLDFLEKNGETVAQTKNYSIDTKFMEQKYVEPQATILIISVDMITLEAGGSFFSEQGEKLITFNDSVGPFHFIQKTEKGYMMTLGFNVVYAKEDDVQLIPAAAPQ